MRAIDKLIVHCTATREGDDSINAEVIDGWHKRRGWSGIGYHFLILIDGTIEHGRPIDKMGAHCKGYNKNSIGISYVGGVEVDGKTPKDTRTQAQKESLLKLLKALKVIFPKADIHGHHDFARKACPSFPATEEYKDL